jgi:hypothetical protein
MAIHRETLSWPIGLKDLTCYKNCLQQAFNCDIFTKIEFMQIAMKGIMCYRFSLQRAGIAETRRE